jgi:hypothetical protein
MIKEIELEDGAGIEYEVTLDGDLVGYYDTRTQAEEALDAATYRRRHIYTREEPTFALWGRFFRKDED